MILVTQGKKSIKAHCWKQCWFNGQGFMQVGY